jgi:ketosteroid isomerase-like protein
VTPVRRPWYGAGMPTLPEARALFARRRDAWLREDLDGYLACWADDVEFASPAHAEPIRGRAAFADLVRRSAAAVRPVSFDFAHLAADGDEVLAEWRIAVARRADGRAIAWWGMSRCTLRDAVIHRWREYWNPADLR